MKFDTRFLRSKVAWRIFNIFICCSLVPIAALAIFSYRNVSGQLEAQSLRRLQQATKSYGMSMLERFQFLDISLSQMVVPPSTPASPGKTVPRPSEDMLGMVSPRFTSSVLFNEPGSAPITLSGNPEYIPALAEDQLEAIKKGDPVLGVEYLKTGQVSIWLAMPTPSTVHPAAYRMGLIDIDNLMGTGFMNFLPTMTELCVLDQNGKIIFSSIGGLASGTTAEFFNRIGGSASRSFEFRHHGVNYLASYWLLFLKSRYFGPNWTVILAQSRAEVLAPLIQFKRIFPLVVLLSVWVVLLMSIVYIRKSLVPLERLKEGTRRLANRDFTTPVTVSTRDEFQDLADSFNTMATEIDRQFKTLTTIAEIDRAILSSLESKVIVATLLERIHDLLTCNVAVIGLVEDGDSRMELHFRNLDTKQSLFQSVETNRFIELASSGHLKIDADTEPDHPLFSLAATPVREFLAVPILLNKRVCGIIAIGSQNKINASEETLSRLSQLSDQVAVAVSNAQLLGELHQLNWETLTALARTVDAKSPWTAGHSERVTQLSLKIGSAMNLTDRDMDILHRAALLHDIGKIAVPSAILDKPGRLTESETKIIWQHPGTGARILEPMSAYREVIPLVLQHHERFDGRGYPQGLAGDGIAAGARILSVADVFDALASDRPYREGWPRQKVVQLIQEGAGTQFDPEVVRVLMRLSSEL